jgi:hypothetical protein
VEGPAPHRECRVRLCVCRGDPAHEGVEGSARNTLRFYQDKELNVTAEQAQAAEHNDHQLCVVSKILGARYNEQEMLHELLVAWRVFPVGAVFQSARPPGSRTLLWLWMFQRW